MEGFKITCNKCRRETILYQETVAMSKDNDNIEISTAGFDGELFIMCKCNNVIDETDKYS
jgi:hypothetical protein